MKRRTSLALLLVAVAAAPLATSPALAAGEVLIREGQLLDRFYVLLDGHMDVSVKGIGTVATLGSGEILGEMSFVDNSPTSASVQAVDTVRLLELNKADLDARFVSDPAAGMRFFKAIAVFLAERMRSTVKRLGYGTGGSIASDELLEDGQRDADPVQRSASDGTCKHAHTLLLPQPL